MIKFPFFLGFVFCRENPLYFLFFFFLLLLLLSKGLWKFQEKKRKKKIIEASMRNIVENFCETSLYYQ